MPRHEAKAELQHPHGAREHHHDEEEPAESLARAPYSSHCVTQSALRGERLILPNFFIIGAAKAATTSLCELIASHPDVGFSNEKETQFFARDALYARGLAHYADFFRGNEGKLAVGEGSPQYTMNSLFPHAATRLAAHLPGARLIYIVRHPLRRMESLWSQSVHWGLRWKDPWEFNQAVHALQADYVDPSCYWRQLSRYRELFSDDQILVLFYEDFRDSPEHVLTRCFDFLRLRQVSIPSARTPRNPTSEHLEDRFLTAWLRKRPGVIRVYRRVRLRYPVPLPGPLLSLLRRPFRSPARWSPENWNRVAAMVKDDAQQFLEYAGKPPHFWDFTSP